MFTDDRPQARRKNVFYGTDCTIHGQGFCISSSYRDPIRLLGPRNQIQPAGAGIPAFSLHSLRIGAFQYARKTRFDAMIIRFGLSM
jgi:hypothetical protein